MKKIEPKFDFNVLYNIVDDEMFEEINVCINFYQLDNFGRDFYKFILYINEKGFKYEVLDSDNYEKLIKIKRY